MTGSAYYHAEALYLMAQGLALLASGEPRAAAAIFAKGAAASALAMAWAKVERDHPNIMGSLSVDISRHLHPEADGSHPE